MANTKYPASPEAMLAFYRHVCGIEHELDYAAIIAIFSQAANDYLDGTIGMHRFGSLSFALYTDNDVEKILDRKNPKLVSVLLDCLDISWLLEDGKFTQEFNDDLREVLKSLSDEKKE